MKDFPQKSQSGRAESATNFRSQAAVLGMVHASIRYSSFPAESITNHVETSQHETK